MILKKACLMSLAYALSMPLLADTRTEVGVIFEIDSPNIFSDQTLGNSKAEIVSQVSETIANRLEFYYPFFDWKAGAATQNQFKVKLIEKENALCDWQADLVVRAVVRRSDGVEIEVEMEGVPPITQLYASCDAYVPSRMNSERNALNADDQKALILKIEQSIGNEAGGLLNVEATRENIHHQFLRKIPVTSHFELKDKPSDPGKKYLYLPIKFSELQSMESACDDSGKNCSRLLLTVNLPDDEIAKFTLRVDGRCGGNVRSKVLRGEAPDFTISSETYWNDDLGKLLDQAVGLRFTMEQFYKDSLACLLGEP